MTASAKGDADQCLAARFVDGPHVSVPDKAEQRLADWLTDLASEHEIGSSPADRAVRHWRGLAGDAGNGSADRSGDRLGSIGVAPCVAAGSCARQAVAAELRFP